MKILKNYDLTKLNTFGISVRAKFFVEIKQELDLKELFLLREFKENKKLFLGGGSNILFIKDFDGLVVLNKLQGIEILKEETESILIKSMSGEIWHDLVSFAVDHGYWGIENLSLIPGTVGAAPVQNIGAYGAELGNVLESVEAYQISNGAKRVFSKSECEFGYRDSIFKNKLKGKYFISAITLKLGKIERKNISYKVLKEYLRKNEIEIKNSKNVSDAVAEIRRSKLPDPALIPNAGSFFKNIFIEKEKMQALLEIYPKMSYFEEEMAVKISSAWLIEQSGPENGTSWKGYRVGNVGVHEHHALVLVNYGGGTGEEIKNLAEQITTSVFRKFGLKLVPEVNIVL